MGPPFGGPCCKLRANQKAKEFPPLKWLTRALGVFCRGAFTSPAKRRGVEGASRRRGLSAFPQLLGSQQDGVGGSGQVPIDRRGRDAHDRDALTSKPMIARFVSRAFVIIPVRGAIDLDREPCGGAIEVEDDRAEGMLSPERRLIRSTAAQPRPEQHLRSTHTFPKRAGAG